jgi:hypothetical protein
VLCDEKYFQGSFDFLPIVSKVAPQPILCKLRSTQDLPGALLPGRRLSADAFGAGR